ncbi:MAG: ribonuclease H-like domain-containing protein [Lachnospiraceae bacterium]|nr:ribonuclease H-like domain-containing protein [Lachnospiraceae bacterium]
MLETNEPLNSRAAAVLDEWFADGNAVLFDIETTGLSHRRTQLYLIGAIARENGLWTLRQWFLDDAKEEKELLIAFSAYIRQFSGTSSDPPLLVHFNGDTFDIPYVHSKCDCYGLPDPFDGMISLDLYRKLRPYRHLFGLEKMRQKDLEQYLGIGREDSMDGGELIRVYQSFLRTKDGEALRLLLLHNHDDVTGMAELVSALAIADFFSSPASCSKPVVDGDSLVFTVCSHHALPDHFLQQALPLNVLMGRPSSSAMIRAALPAADPVSITLKWQPLESDGQKSDALHSSESDLQNNDALQPSESNLQKNDTLQLSVPLFRGTLLHFFPDYRNYWYFPAQDGVIHKDLAIYADAGHREKARPENCYQRVTSVFCPQPEEIYTPVCCRSYKSFPSWFVYSEDVFKDEVKRLSYIHSLLQQIL